MGEDNSVEAEIQALYAMQAEYAARVAHKRKAYEASIQMETAEIRRIDGRVLELVAASVQLDPEDLVRGYWDCPASPTGTCFYNGPEDPAHDDCLFCHDPRERK